MNAAQERARDLATDEVAELDAMRRHNGGFVTVTEPALAQGGRAAGPVAANLAGRLATARSERRAAERKERNLAKFQDDAEELAVPPVPPPASPETDDDFAAEGLL